MVDKNQLTEEAQHLIANLDDRVEHALAALHALVKEGAEHADLSTGDFNEASAPDDIDEMMTLQYIAGMTPVEFWNHIAAGMFSSKPDEPKGT